MTHQQNRRTFLQAGSLGLAGLAAHSLLLPEGITATEASGTNAAAAKYLAAGGPGQGRAVLTDSLAAPSKFTPTEDNILGPYHRDNAPFRGKVTPPLEPGELLVVRGRVWGADTRKPLAGALLDIWQANAKGRYDNDDRKNPPAADLFVNRCRLMTDANGYYEYETIKPGRYQIGQGRWRPAHIHYLVRQRGYQTLVTQMYFHDDPENARDQFIKPSLITTPQTVTTPNGKFLLDTFDIVLAKA